MAAEIASAFVRIRPNMAGFKSETESGVRGAFSGVGKIVGAAFAVGGTVEALKSIGEAAAADQAAFDVLDRNLKNARASNTLYGQSIDDLIKKQAKQRGFSDEDLASSFVRLVSATKDTGKAYRDLGIAEDVARARHIGVAQAALAVSKAEQGVTTSLQRLGIIIRPVTTAQDALAKSRAQAVASGAVFSKQQDLIYKSALAQAKAQDQVASRTQAISTLQQRFGGSAATFANTASGAWARLHEQVHLFEVFIAERFIPGFTSGLTAVGNFLSRLSENQGFRQSLNTIFSDIRSGADAVKGPLEAVASAARDVTHAVGGTTILAAVVAWKAFGVAVNVGQGAMARWAAARTAAAAAQARGTAADEAGSAVETAFAKAVLASAAAQVAATEALIANSVARTENTAITASGVSTLRAVDAALGGDIAATTADTAATRALAVAKEELAAAQATAAAATTGAAAEGAASAGVFATLRAGMLGLVGGPIGAVTLGVAGLAAGIAYLVTRQSSWDKANQATADSLGALNDAIKRTASLRGERRDTVGQLPQDRTAVAQARLNVEQARASLATTTAARGSIQYQQAVLNVQQAVQQYRSALQSLGNDQRHAGTLDKDLANQSAATQQALRQTTDDVAKLAEAYRVKAAFETGRGPAGAGLNDTAREARAASRSLDGFVQALGRDAAALQKLHPLAATNTALLAQFAQQVGRIPTRHETKLILSNRDATATLQDVLNRIFPTAFQQMGSAAMLGGQAVGDQFWAGLDTSLGGAAKSKLFPGAVGELLAGLKNDVTKATTKTSTAASRAAVQAANDAAATARQQAAAAASAVGAARDNLASVSQSAAEAIQSAKQSVSDAQQSLADAITSGQSQITNAVLQAKQNLFTIGQKISSDIETFLQGQNQGGGPLTGSAAKAFAALRAKIAKGEGGPEVGRAAQALSAQLQAASAKTALADSKKTVQTQIADLVDAFNRGPQNAAAIRKFNAGIARILKLDKVTFKAVAKELGTAAAHDLFDAIDAAKAQARATAAGPRRRGGGDEPTIVRPEQTVIQVQRQIAQAGQALQRAQIAEAKTQTTQLKDIAKATKALNGKVKAADFTKTLAGRKAQHARDVKTKVAGK